MMNRRFFLSALGGGVFALSGCARKPYSVPGATAAVIPVTTVITAAQAAAAPQLTAHPVRFTDVSRAAGLTWAFTNGATGRHLMIEDLSGGVALFDYNGDGLLDIFAPQGGPVPGAPPGPQQNFSTRSVLYRNNGNGTFTDVTVEAGLSGNLGYGMGVSVADFNNDGHPDLYVTCYGGNRLLRNNGNGTFTDVTHTAGLADLHGMAPGEPPWPLSAAWGDYDNDGCLDLFVCHYCRWSPALNKPCRAEDGKTLDYCRPQVYQSSHCSLYHNNGDGTFTNVTHAAGIDRLQGKSMGAVWLDYDGDGWMDLFVTNDTMPNFLLHNNRNGTFTDKGTLAGVAYSDQGEPLSGMGIGVGDYKNEGREDLFVVNFSGEPKSVFHNTGGGIFESATYQSNIASTNLQFLGFGLECFDYDLDGWLDLVVGNGHVLDRMDAGTAGSSYAQSQQLFHNQRDGTFQEDLHSLGDLVNPQVTRGLAVGDYDNDGDIDVVMISQLGPLSLFRNDGGNANHWITFRLEGVHGNRDAYGAQVTVHTPQGPRARWVHGSSSYCSHSDTRLTFGLADAASITGGEIVWPRGKGQTANHRQTFGPLAGNQFYYVKEGDAPIPDPRIHPSAS